MRLSGRPRGDLTVAVLVALGLFACAERQDGLVDTIDEAPGIGAQGTDLTESDPVTAGAIIVVCPDGESEVAGCDYRGGAGIQQAIDAAPNGSPLHRTRIVIRAGDYSRDDYSLYSYQVGDRAYLYKALAVAQGKYLDLIAEPGAFLTGSADHPSGGLIIAGGDAVVRGLAIADMAPDPDSCGDVEGSHCSLGFGILVVDGRAVVRDVDITGSQRGVVAWGQSVVDVQDSHFEANVTGLRVSHEAILVASRTEVHGNAYGATATLSGTLIVSESTISESSLFDLSSWSTAQLIVVRSSLSGSPYALALHDSSVGNVIHSRLEGARGAVARHDSTLQLTNTLVRGASEVGIGAWESSTVRVGSIQIEDSKIGLFATDDADLVVDDSAVLNSTSFGLSAAGRATVSVTGTTFYGTVGVAIIQLTDCSGGLDPQLSIVNSIFAETQKAAGGFGGWGVSNTCAPAYDNDTIPREHNIEHASEGEPCAEYSLCGFKSLDGTVALPMPNLDLD